MKKIERGRKVPSFYRKMLRNIIEIELANCLKNREDLFLIDLDIALDNSVKIIIDGDKGVSVDDCMYVSRSIEHSIDRDKHDFSLEVSSSGALTPLSSIRQYMKNIGRTLFVRTTNDIDYEAKLIDANSIPFGIEMFLKLSSAFFFLFFFFFFFLFFLFYYSCNI